MPPSLILAVVLGSIYGLLFQSVFGRRLWQLPCYWAAGLSGFIAGEVLAVLTGVEIFRLGNIPLVGATVGSLVALGICWFFISLPPERRTGQRRSTRRRPIRQSS